MNRLIIFLFFVASVATYFSCTKPNDFITDSSAKLEFSVDTLRFDTVFTELGSATRFIRVYNRNKKPIQISKIMLAEGSESFFRLNVDGIPGDDATDIKVPAEDSIYIFAEVTVDPDNPLSTSPFVISEDLIFQTNGNEQRVVLEAWGQNANYIPNRFNAGGIAGISSCDFGEIVWDDPKPYVIYGILFIDSCTLTLPAGTDVYVHGGFGRSEDNEGETFLYNDGRIFIGPKGKINIKGTQERPVVLQGDRLEESFQDDPAQWFGLFISATSKNNVIEHAVIKNSIIGVYVDSLASLSLKNTQIYNTAGNTLTAIHANVTADNCLFYNPGRSGYCVALAHGGTHKFNYCTMASYGVDQSAVALTNFTCYDPDNTICDVNPMRATFKNCIIAGSRNNELDFVDAAQGEEPLLFQVEFENCAVRLEELDKFTHFQDFFENYCEDCIPLTRQDALFVDADEDIYYLDTLSVVENQAMVIPLIDMDLDGVMRDGSTPDIGCYEYVVQ